MLNSKLFFCHFQPWSQQYPVSHVILVDGKTRAKIEGVGTAKIRINNKHTLHLHNAIFVPSLSTCLYSIKEHLCYAGCSQFAEGLTFTLTILTFIVDTNIDKKITLNIAPSSSPPNLDILTAPPYASPVKKPYPTPLYFAVTTATPSSSPGTQPILILDNNSTSAPQYQGNTTTSLPLVFNILPSLPHSKIPQPFQDKTLFLLYSAANYNILPHSSIRADTGVILQQKN